MHELLGTGDLIDRGVQFYKIHLRQILGILFIQIVASLICALIDTALLWKYPSGSRLTIGVSVVLSIGVLAVSLLTTIRLMRYTAGVISEQKIPFDLRTAKSLFWRTAIVTVLAGLIVALGLAAFVIPGILFWTWFAFAPLGAAIENTPWKTALTQSALLSQGKFTAVLWRLFGSSAFFLLLQIVLVLCTIFFFQGIFRGIWSIELSFSGAPLWFLLLSAGVVDILRSLLSPLFAITATILYHALKITPPQKAAPL